MNSDAIARTSISCHSPPRQPDNRKKKSYKYLPCPKRLLFVGQGKKSVNVFPLQQSAVPIAYMVKSRVKEEEKRQSKLFPFLVIFLPVIHYPRYVRVPTIPLALCAHFQGPEARTDTAEFWPSLEKRKTGKTFNLFSLSGIHWHNGTRSSEELSVWRSWLVRVRTV